MDYGVAIDINGRLWSVQPEQEPISRKERVHTTYDIQEFTKVSSGETANIGIDEEGRMWKWGDNVKNPVLVGGTYEQISNDKFVDVSVNSQTTLALDKQGKVWAWGKGEYLGIDTSKTIAQPECLTRYTDHILEGKTINKISNCKNINMLIDNDGKLYLMTTYNKTKILNEEYENLKDVKFIDVKGVGNDGILALDNEGKVWLTRSYTATPQQIDFNGVKIKSISGSKFSNGYTHYLVIDEDGDLWVWGDNNVGQLGIPASEQTELTMPLCLTKTETIANEDNILYNKKIVKALASDRMSAVVDNLGKMYTFGLNTYGQLGQNIEDTNAVLGIKCINGDNGLEVKDISLGKNYCLLIDSNGNIWSWGYNNSYSTGRNETYTILPLKTNGTTYKYSEDILLNQYENISDAIPTQTSIKYVDNNEGNKYDSNKIKQKEICNSTYGGLAYIELDTEGNLWTYGGNNSSGILGDGTTDSWSEPKCINYMFDNKKIDEILYFGRVYNRSEYIANGVVKDKENNIWIWGDNDLGQCGTDESSVVLTPICINQIKGFEVDKVIGSGSTNIVQDTEGKIWSWGDNREGQCGNGTTSNVLEPTCINQTKGFLVDKVILGGVINIVQDTEGKIWSWGSNRFGSCGTGTTNNVLEPTCINEDNRFVLDKVICGGIANIVQDTEGRIWSWGYNNKGECGTGTTDNVLEPTCINEDNRIFVEKVIATRSNYNSTIILQDTEGKIWSWGDNSVGQCGRRDDLLVPKCINENNFTVKQILVLKKRRQRYSSETLEEVSTIIVEDIEGKIWTWGQNYYGECGTGTTYDVLEPTCINEETPFSIEQVILLDDTIILEDTNGRIWSWGMNLVGQCGNGRNEWASAITCINEENNFVVDKIISAGSTNIIQDKEGRIWSWGSNYYGQCGTGTTNNVLEPTCINEETPFTIERVILDFSVSKMMMLQDTEGGIWTWGQNQYGQCGNGTVEDVSGIVCINKGNPFKIEDIIYNELSNSSNKFIIIQDTQKRIWTWGQNQYGECGTGNTTPVLSPVCISNNAPMDLIGSNIIITNDSVLVINKNNEAYIWTSTAQASKINDIDGINGKEIKEIAITISGIMALDIDGNLYAINDDLKSLNGIGKAIIIGTYGTGQWIKDFVSISDSKY